MEEQCVNNIVKHSLVFFLFNIKLQIVDDQQPLYLYCTV